MSRIVMPNYQKSVLNTITSVMKYYNVPTEHASLKCLDDLLDNGYKHVVLIVLDGMGEKILKKISSKGFFAQNQLETVTSVCPSTTTAALTTYYSGKPPYETGWIAWSQYFKEYGRALDMLPQRESYLGDKLKKPRIDVFKDVVGYESVFTKIEKASPNVKAYEIVPDYSERHSKRCIKANNIDEAIMSIADLCEMPSESFIMAYVDNPDSLLHKFGTDSEQVRNNVIDAQDKIEKLCKSLDDDTIVIVSADHGHKNIEKAYQILDYPELNECLIMPASLESRFLTFWVKDNMRMRFETIFTEVFGNDFILMTKDELLDKRLLGPGFRHKKIDDFIGNYVAISIGSTIIRLETYLAEGKPVKKSTHCGLTEDEMLVPLVVWTKERK